MTKRFFPCLAVFLVLVSHVGVVFASSYQTSFKLVEYLEGPIRAFNGQSIAFKSSYAQSLPGPHFFNKNYRVELHRDELIGYDYIGQVILERDAPGLAQWSNVGPGNYYVIMTKANDGVTLVDDDVQIYNY